MKKQTLQLISMVVIAIFSITIANAQIINKSGDVSGETWTAGTYYVSDNIWVNANSSLTIQEGSVIKFQHGKSLKVYGTLDVNGADGNNVIFTSKDDDNNGEFITGSDGDPNPGDWFGIKLDGHSVDNQGIGEFDWCLIRYGGKHWGNADANVHFHYSTSGHFINSISEYSHFPALKTTHCSPEINNSIFRNSNSYGVYCNNYSATITQNTFSDNGDDGLYITGDCTPTITYNIFNNNDGYGVYLNNLHLTSLPGNTGIGNTYNAIALSGTIDTSFVFTNLIDFPYVIHGDITVITDNTLTIAEGTVMKFGSGIWLTVYGTLDVNGTPDNKVVFTSFLDDEYGGDTNGDSTATSPYPGVWWGIKLNGYYANNQGIGEFDWCLIRYGGKHWGNADANVHFHYSTSGHFINSISEYSHFPALKTTHCSPEINNSIFRNSNDHGIYCHNYSATITENTFSDNGDDGLYITGDCTPTITNNTFNNNDGYGAYLNNLHLTSLPGNTGIGNTYNAIALSGTVDTSFVFTNLIDFPYVIHGNITVTTNNTLTIAEGTVMKFGSSIWLTVYGTLDVNGTPDNKVVFTSFLDDEYGGDTNGDSTATSPYPGVWWGIKLNGIDANNQGIGEFDWCLIRYGGKYWGNADANVHFYYSTSGHFINSISEYSHLPALRTTYCSPEINNSTFRNSNDHGVYCYNSSPIIRGSFIENNADYGIYITGSNSIPDLGANDPADKGLNTIQNNDDGNFQVYNNTANIINAYYNIWGYDNADSIDAHIYDDNENPAKGEVLFEPWLTGVLVAEFIAIPTSGIAPLTVNFTDLSTGDPTNWEWDFQNDGTIDSYIQNPEWIYTEAGIYTVSLTVSDGTNIDTEIKTDYISVSGGSVLDPPTNLSVTELGYATWEAPSGGGGDEFTEGFESGDIPAGWLAIDYDGDGYNWGVWDLYVHTGTYSACSFSYINNPGVAVTPDNYLITPQVELGGSSQLTFWVGASDADWYWEHFKVKLSTTGSDPIDFTTELMDYTLTTDAWVQLTIDLSAYSGQQVYLSWVHCDVTDVYNLSLDDIELTNAKQLIFAADFESNDDNDKFKRVSVAGNSIPFKVNMPMSELEIKSRMNNYLSQKDPLPAEYTLLGYKVYLDGVYVDFTTNLFWQYSGLTSGVNYIAGVSALYDEGESIIIEEPFTYIQLTADFTADVTSGFAPLEVQFTDLSTGNPETWLWDFGDGETSALQNPAHEYISFGSYTVSLTVTAGGYESTEVKDYFIDVYQTENGDWTLQHICIENTPEADMMIRTGDIDNLGFGWPAWFDPFTGQSTPQHGFPWTPNPEDAGGTDRIMVVTSYTGINIPCGRDGYTNTTSRPENLPEPVVLEMCDLSGITITDAAIQIFVDDIQPLSFCSHYAVTLNGNTLNSLETVINQIDQSGPIGRMLTVKIPGELLYLLEEPTVTVSVDDTTTGAGDGFAIDFVKLLINPIVLAHSGNIAAYITDASTSNPLENAEVEASFWTSELTGQNGEALLTGVPAGLVYVEARKAGYQTVSATLNLESGETVNWQTSLVPLLAADFTASPLSGQAPLEVNFTDLSTGNPASWEWDFQNDGTIDSYDPNPEWIYIEPGIYTVSLTISDGTNTDTEIKNDYITVSGGTVLDPPTNLSVTELGYATWEAPSGGGGDEFTEGFESGDIPAGWLAIDYDGDGYNWGVWDLYVHTGTYSACSFSYINNPGVAVTPDNYLITPQVELGGSSQLTFWVGASDADWYWEHFKVKLSTTGSDPIDFTTELMDYTLTTDAWVQLTIDLSAYSGQQVYLSWVHCDVTDVYNLSLDDIELTNAKQLIFAADFESNDDNDKFKRVSVAGNSIPFKVNMPMSELEIKSRMNNYLSQKDPLPAEYTLLGYKVYLDGVYVDFTTNLFWQYSGLTSGVNYIAGVSALYDEGESAIVEYEFTYNSGQSSFALQFDGTDDYVNCGHDASLNLTSTLTIETWINPAGWGELADYGYGRIVDKTKFKLFLNDDGSGSYNAHSLVFGMHSGSSFALNTPENSIILDSWQHIAATYDGNGDVHIYINGIEQTLTGDAPSGSLNDNSLDDLFIGESFNQNRAFEGNIDELRIWNIVRSQEEIQANLTEYLSGTESGLAGYYRMNEGSGQFAFDLSGNGNDGQLGSTPGTDVNDPTWIATNWPYEVVFALDLKVYLQGPFNGTDMNIDLNSAGFIPVNQPYDTLPWNYGGAEFADPIPANVVDWVLIDFRDAADAASATTGTIFKQQAAFLLNNGSIVDSSGMSILSFNHFIIQSLFVAVWHRNHIPVLSANPANNAGSVYNYNFSTSADQAYGTDAQKHLGSNIYGMYGGDANADSIVDLADKAVWASQAGTRGYKSGDFTMDGQVNNQDKNDVWVGNIGAESQVPE